MSRRAALSAMLISALLLSLASTAAGEAGYIDPTDKWGWAETSGWLNFRPTHEAPFVHEDHLTGFIWQENMGWIKLGSGSGPYANTSATDWGVNRDVSGHLSGYVWSENGGGINFGPTHGGATIDPDTGETEGFVWSENVGWIHLRHAPSGYGVRVVFLVVPALGAAGLAVALASIGLRLVRRSRIHGIAPERCGIEPDG